MRVMPDKIRLTLFTVLPLCRKEGLTAFLEGLEAGGLTPTNWGENERAPNAYDRSVFLAEVADYSPGVRMPGIASRTGLKYTGHFNADASVQGVYLEFIGKVDLRTVFASGSHLAEPLNPLFGFVHPVWLGKGQEYNVSGRLDRKEFMKFGPRAMCARTWLGRSLVELIGRELLDRSGAVVETASGIEVDLLPEPWERDIEALADAQRRVMAVLAPVGVFGDYAVSRQYKPGQRWAAPE
jgi:hypothetical protein